MRYQVHGRYRDEVSYYAECTDCDFNKGKSFAVHHQGVRDAAREHVQQTGHTVVITSCNEIIYEPKQQLGQS